MGESGGRRLLGIVLALLLVAAAAGMGWWASRATLTSTVPAEGEPVSQAVVWAEATEGSVGRSLPLSSTLRQPAVPVAQNTLTGVVTRVSPGEVDQGDVVYVVGDTPVRVVQGEGPFWRDLATGAKGEDVTALQVLLIDQGHLDGEADGEFGPGTLRAVRAWQKAEGREQTGTVPLGELIAVPDLPAVVQLGEAIVVGQTLGGGEDAVLAPTGDREFVLVVTQDQARLIPAEATVEISYEDHTWDAVIASTELDEFGSTTFQLTGPDGGEVCGGECGVLPNDAQVTLRSEVVIVPQVEGTTVPAAAVRTRADGTAYVITDSGEVDVAVTGSGQGIAVVDGIEAGTRVQVLDGTPGPQPAQAPVDGAEATEDG
ncbi:peptidoglycan-binding domain-containing protein [Ornithinimicrobium sufpigmenti]|uniref:peptidoglycan-binding domain-containing protein n=1 Tax=Ornithinimicrobium sufpigmenti TaxID=2508882 RepID=UPI0015E17001|nr:MULTISPECIES: peptidoglycan-binding protein [unclassified Ornithinimicrobium]